MASEVQQAPAGTPSADVVRIDFNINFDLNMISCLIPLVSCCSVWLLIVSDCVFRRV